MRSAIVVCIVLAAVPAYADEEGDVDAARVHYDRGIKHYNLAEYDDAIREFKTAYEISPAPKLLFNIAQSYRLKGDCKQALAFYKNYIRLETDDETRTNAEPLQAAMEKCVAEGEAAPADSGSEPGPPPAPAKRGSGRRLTGWIAVGTGAVAAGVGLGFGLAARSAWDDAESMCTELVCTPAGDARASDARTYADVSTVVVSGGLVVAAVGVVLILTAPSGGGSATEGQQTRLLPSLGPNGAGLVLAGSF